ncbi:hypothetical protein M0722_00575 [Microbacterium sp. KSW4-16]|uniref:hypothetical protein n=1 Tax=Microbacterium TaxID=33882 RepID=UPI001404B90B|nr:MULTISPECIES: hypothetical protein [Microbacterium]MCK8465677.1 hypothetical protein [Microbacterium aurugineum]
MAAVALLVGCAPDPGPTPTPTAAFASEEEAFAAAEATYRAYADASNSTDLHDPQTFESVYAWLRGDALAAARENYSQFYASGMTRTGDTLFDSFTPISYENSTVTARLCLDVSEVGLVDAEGISVVPDERAPRQALEVQFTNAQTSSSLAISSTIATSEIEC